MADNGAPPQAWKAWIAPGVAATLVIGVLTIQMQNLLGRFTALDSRFESVERRMTSLDEKFDRIASETQARIAEARDYMVQTNERVDRVLEIQTSNAKEVAQLRTDTEYLKSRVDQVARKLDVASSSTLDPSLWLTLDTNKGEPIYDESITDEDDIMWGWSWSVGPSSVVVDRDSWLGILAKLKESGINPTEVFGVTEGGSLPRTRQGQKDE